MTNSTNSPEAKKAEPRRVFEGVCELIRQEITRGTLKPGDKLPAEREMAERYKVGRNAVREALRTLEIAGVVRLQKGRNGGPYVCVPSSARVTHAIGDLIAYGSLGWKDLTEARSLVLDIVIRLAVERGTPSDFDAIERNVNLTESADAESREEHAYEFYQLLARCTHNAILILLVTSMSDLLRRFVSAAFEDAEVPPLPSLVPTRRRMLKALRSADPERASAELEKQLREVHVRIHERIALAENRGNASSTLEAQIHRLAELEAENLQLRKRLMASRPKTSPTRKSNPVLRTAGSR